MRRLSSTLVALLLVVPVLGACGDDDSPTVEGGDATTTTAAEPANPTFEAKEFSFDVPTGLTAGTITLGFDNTGEQTHAFNINKVDGVHTLDEISKAVQDEENPAEYLSSAGGSILDPGKATEYTGTFAEGNYAIYCPVPSSNPADQGKPHSALGMVALFAVGAGTNDGAAPPEDITITAKDYTWEGLDGITAGDHVLKFTNAGPEDHELVAFKLMPGKKAADVAAFFDPEAPPAAGPPPFTGIPGVISPLEKDQTGVVKITFEAGDYGLFCFVGNQKGPHFAQGMIKDITVA